MTDIPTAHCPDLGAITKVFPDDKRLTVTVPFNSFVNGDDIGVNGKVELYERATWQRKADPESGRVRGRVKGLLVEVEIDLATFEVPIPQAQEQLG